MSRKEERTPRDRERDRLEREARRAAREGRPPPAALPPNEIPPPPVDDRPSPEPVREEPEPEPFGHEPEPEPLADRPEPEPDWEEPEPEEPEPGWEEPEPEAEPEHDPARAWNDRSHQPEEASGPHQSEGGNGLHEPRIAEPSGSGPADPWQGATPAVEPAPEPSPTAPRPPAMPPPFQPSDRRPPIEPSPGYTLHRASGPRTTAQDVLRGDSGGRGRRILPLLALATVVLLAIWFLFSLFQPFGGEGEGQVRVVIAQGSGVGAIADVLADKGVISSPFFFKARARVSGRSGDLKAGTFRMRKDMSYAAALDALAQGAPPDVVRVTVPEGRARREVKDLVGTRLKGDYLALTTRSDELDPRRYGAKGAANLEGFLFPATYDVKRGRPMADLVNLQLRAFKREFAKVDLRGAARKRLTPYDVLTIASMVDREAQVPSERRIIASVIFNRLRDGIPLGIDATIRFATNNWTKPLRESQLRIDSPYNTRARRGLPPGPIGSPGLSAIRAAARPASTGFLFYVVKPGTCGRHAFSRTDAEFQQDVARYNAERSRRGGKSPTNC